MSGIGFGTLKSPLLPQSGAGAHMVARGWADTKTGRVLVVAKRMPRFELVREVVGSLLAQAAGLPTPVPYVLETRGTEWQDNEGYAFATGYEGHYDLLRTARTSPPVVQGLVRWPHFPCAIAFDEWTANEDRTLSNLLLVGEREYLLIDHGSACQTTCAPTASSATASPATWSRANQTRAGMTSRAA